MRWPRTPLVGLGDRLPAGSLVEFLLNPHARYPDRRMPRVPMTREAARDIAAFLLMWSPASDSDSAKPPDPAEIDVVARRLNLRRPAEIAQAIIREIRCADCHIGLGPVSSTEVPLAAANDSRGCLFGKTLPRYSLDESGRRAIDAYIAVAPREKHPSPFESRQRVVRHLGCLRCHQRDSDRPPPIELVAGTLGGSNLETIPFQRTPRLHFVHQKYSASHLLSAVRDGVAGLRHAR